MIVVALMGQAAATAESGVQWLEVVLQATGRDGTWSPAAQVATDFDRACRGGVAAACGDPGWARPFDPSAALAPMREHCRSGDAVSCVVAGWASAPHEASTFFERGCELSLDRGCTEYVLQDAQGPDTWYALVDLCERKEPAACLALAPLSSATDRPALLQYTADLGSMAAVEAQSALRSTDTQQAAALLDRACAGGRPTACLTRARASNDGSEVVGTSLQRGCELGSLLACARLGTWRAEHQGADVASAIAAHQRVCDASHTASCAEARLLDSGAPPRTFARWGMVEWRRQSVTVGLQEVVRSCYRERLFRGEVRGRLRVTVQLNRTGRAEGTALEGPMVDDGLKACVAKIHGVPTTDPPGENVRGTVTLGLDHQARVDVLQVFSDDDVVDATTATRMLDDRRSTVDRCLVQHGEIDPEPLVLTMTLDREGRARRAKVLQSTRQPQVDACVLEVLAREAGPGRLKSAMRMMVSIDFLEWTDPGEQDPEVRLSLAWTEPVTWSLLSLVGPSPGQTEVSAKQLAALQAAHATAAAFLARHTRGGVTLTYEVRPTRRAVAGWVLDELIDGENVTRWVVQEGTAPRDAFSGRMESHSAILWAPLDKGEDAPDLAATMEDSHWRGATMSSAPFGGQPSWVRIVELLYRQLAVRSPQVSWPSPDAVMELPDGRTFEPRPWMKSANPQLWFAWAFAEGVDPEAVRGALQVRPEGVPQRGENVAWKGEATASRDMLDLQHLNDGVVAMRGMRSHARQGSVAKTPPDGTWVGLTFDEPTVVAEVRPWLSTHLQPNRSTADAVSLEVTVDGETWHTVARIEPVRSTVPRLVIPPTEVRALRVRIDVEAVDVPVAVRELEVYASATPDGP